MRMPVWPVAANAVQENTEVVRTNDFLEHLVDSVLTLFNVRESGNTAIHYGVAELTGCEVPVNRG